MKLAIKFHQVLETLLLVKESQVLAFQDRKTEEKNQLLLLHVLASCASTGEVESIRKQVKVNTTTTNGNDIILLNIEIYHRYLSHYYRVVKLLKFHI